MTPIRLYKNNTDTQFEVESKAANHLLPLYDPHSGQPPQVTVGRTDYDWSFATGMVFELKVKSTVRVFIEKYNPYGEVKSSSVLGTRADMFMIISLGLCNKDDPLGVPLPSNALLYQGKVHLVPKNYMLHNVQHLPRSRCVEHVTLPDGSQGFNTIPYYSFAPECFYGVVPIELDQNSTQDDSRMSAFDLDGIRPYSKFDFDKLESLRIKWDKIAKSKLKRQ